MQVDATVGIAAACAVFHISFDGTSDGRQLGPDLVVPAGNQLNVKQMVMFAAFKSNW